MPIAATRTEIGFAFARDLARYFFVGIAQVD
jgi:hypothetical protein